jgi:type IV secretion system protein TrbB
MSDLARTLSAREQANCRVAETRRRQLGRFCQTLGEPDPIELMLNADGKVWADHLGRGMSVIGTMGATTAESFITTAASTLRGTVTRDNPPVERELPAEPPFDGSRFRSADSTCGVGADFHHSAQGMVRVHHARLPRSRHPGRESARGDRGCRRDTPEHFGGRWDRLGQDNAGERDTGRNCCRYAYAPSCRQRRHGRAAMQRGESVLLRATDTVTMNRLLKATMRLRPDQIVVGEVRGGDALTLLNALNTGHPGGVCTVHANSVGAGPIRLEQLSRKRVRARCAASSRRPWTCLCSSRRPTPLPGRRVTEILAVTGGIRAEAKAWGFDTDDPAAFRKAVAGDRAPREAAGKDRK